MTFVGRSPSTQKTDEYALLGRSILRSHIFGAVHGVPTWARNAAKAWKGTLSSKLGVRPGRTLLDAGVPALGANRAHSRPILHP